MEWRRCHLPEVPKYGDHVPVGPRALVERDVPGIGERLIAGSRELCYRDSGNGNCVGTPFPHAAGDGRSARGHGD